MNNPNSSDDQQNKKKQRGLASKIENPGRRSFFMLCTALVAAPFLYKGDRNGRSDGHPTPLTNRGTASADLASVTADSTQLTIGASTLHRITID